ncbi:MAG: HAD family hydrolase [Lachnospiraceae bacterium]|nr:HAD family hydrolase [Lachnospiraceae bacterium]
MREKNTVIFDMDGTVLNTLEDLTDAVNYVLERFGMPLRTLEEYRRFFGSGIRVAITCAVPEGTPESTIDAMLPVFREYYTAHCLDKTGPYDGILPLMKTLKERGYRCAIVSNKIDPAVKELNERFFAEYVDVAIGERPGVARKPAPDMVRIAMEELGAAPEESVYVGDSEVDLQTAENAGLPCIVALWGFRDRDFLEAQGATVFAEQPADVANILAGGI